MAHYAKIEDGLVAQVLVVEESQFDWLTETLGGVWVQTSYNTRGGIHYTDGVPSDDQSKALRKNYAGIGFTYDADRDAFIPPKPDGFDSFVLDEDTCQWVPPVPMPEGGDYIWNESTQSWDAVSEA